MGRGHSGDFFETEIFGELVRSFEKTSTTSKRVSMSSNYFQIKNKQEALQHCDNLHNNDSTVLKEEN